MYHNPVRVVETNNWQEECRNFQEKLDIQNPLVITSNGIFKRLNLHSVFDSRSIFWDVKPNPTFGSCQAAINFVSMSKFDGVIAIGGGSVMDTAKVAMAVIGTGICDLNELLTTTTPYKHGVPSIFMPTTHGTGSEVTKWGTIWNLGDKKKYSISHPDLYPSIAILDGNLTLSLPLDISIVTIMDALSHSFEAIWNKKANDTSTFYATEAISLILKNVEGLKNNLHDVELRNKLLNAANKAGLAFSNTKTAAAHSISYPLTIKYGIPHGIASSISLIPLLRINGDSIQSSLDKICEKTDLKFEGLISAIKSIPKGVIPCTLDEWGIKEDQLPKLASECFTKGRMDNNIVDLDDNYVLNILKEIYN